jgi:hypothetical protein
MKMGFIQKDLIKDERRLNSQIESPMMRFSPD